MGHDAIPIWMRPERAATGRPAERSRAEITEAALAVAARGGIDAVSMRNVAAELGTGAASLYRYVSGRDDLLDLMIDATAADYSLGAPTGDPVADLLAVAEQGHAIMLRHPWLPDLVVTRPTLGPNAVDVLEHVLDVLADTPVDPDRRLEVFAVTNAVVAAFAKAEIADADGSASMPYLAHIVREGAHPRIAELVASVASAPDPDRRRRGVLTAVLAGLLGVVGR